MSKVIKAQLEITGKDGVSPLFGKIATEAKRSADAIKRAAEIDGVLKKYGTLTKEMGAAASAQQRLAGQVVRDAATINKALNLSEPLRRDIAALQLTRREISALARDAQRMAADQEKAVAGIGNAKVRAQVVRAAEADMEARLRTRAQGLAAQRAQEEAFQRQLGVMSRAEIAAAATARKNDLAAERQAAAEKLRIAREAARAAREAERQAAREATEDSRRAAQAAREEARARIAAAREASRAVRQAHRDEAREVAEIRRRTRSFGGVAAGAIGLGGGGYVVSQGVRRAARIGADSVREDARDYLGGMSDADSERIKRRALELSMKYRSVDATTFHERLRDTAMSMGSVDKAMQVSDTIAQQHVVLQSLKGKEKALEEGRRFSAALDNLGKNQDPAQVHRLSDGYLKALGVEGADLDMGSLLQIARKAKSGGGGLSDRFLMGVAPALSMDMGPNELGTAIGTEISQLIGGRATKKSKAYQQEIGLRDKKGNFLDRDLIVSDPYRYTLEKLIPKLQAKGINVDNDGAVIEATSKLFSQQTVANLFTKMITQREQYSRKLQQYDAAPGIEAAGKLADKDPYVAAASAMAQMANAAQQLAEPIMPAATKALNAWAETMAGATDWMSKNPETIKNSAAPAGLLAAILGPQAAGWLMQKLAGDGTGFLANALRLGGQGLSGIGSFLGYGASMGAPTALGMGANETGAVNDQGLLNLLRGQETPTARIARLLAEERRRQTGDGLTISEATREARERAAAARNAGPTVDDEIMARARRKAAERMADPESYRGNEIMRRNAAEAWGRETGEAVGVAIADGVRAKAPEAGQAAGQGIADGIKAKTPEVETQGRTILEKMQQIFSRGVFLPINFVPGEGGFGGGGNGIQTASFSPGGGGMGGLREIRPGGRFGGLAIGGGGGTTRASLPAGAPAAFGRGGTAALPKGAGAPASGTTLSRAGSMYDALRGAGFDHLHASALMGHQMEESTMNTAAWNPKEGAAGSIQWRADRRERLQAHARSMGLDWRDPRAQASFIRWEMANTERRSGARFLGSRTLEEASAALRGYIRYGSPTAADRLGHARTFDRQFRGRVPGTPGNPVASGMPAPGPGYMVPLHKGGTGLSRYSDEQLREIEAENTRRQGLEQAPRIPEGASLRGGGFGGGAADRMEAAAARIESASLRTHHTVEVMASPGLQARTRGMSATGRGPIKANVGVSMPGARDDGDWV
ncbi:phage tail tip lysozyme [Methylobacterium aquaticum]|uniref:phage tail tip lysozyme n=1 Tax=Methylobacterium aquaticum TaxID=270351 RepID=UPI003D172F61